MNCRKICDSSVVVLFATTENSSWPVIDRSRFLLKNSHEYDIIIETIGKEPQLTMNEIGYSLILQESCHMPNGKALVRLDFMMKG